MSMIDRISAQLITIEQKLKKMLDKPDIAEISGTPHPKELGLSVSAIHYTRQDTDCPELSEMSQSAQSQALESPIALESNIESLHKSIQRLNILSEITNDVKGKYLLKEVVDATLDAIGRRAPLSFTVLILGERELGPYYYHGMQGEPAPWRYLLGECPFPLSGALAQAILRRREANEPDYLLYEDLAVNRPSSDEFPWLPDDGSLMFVPLRFAQQTIGVLMLGMPRTSGFDDDTLCKDLYDIASISAEAIRTAQMHQEVNNNAEKLVNAQLITREISLVEDSPALITILTDRLSEIAGKVNVNVYLQPSLHYLGDSDHSPINLPNLRTKLQLVSPNLDENVDASSSIVTELLQWAMNAGQPLFYDPSAVETQSEHTLYNDTGSAMIVPISDHQQAYGALHLTVLNPQRRFDESDMVVLRTIANSAATAFAKFQLQREKENSILSALRPMVDIVESRFPSLQGHSERTAHNAALLARYLGLTEKKCMEIRVAASLHDIGMASLSDAKLDMALFESEMIPLTTINTLQSSQDILNRAGISPNITELVVRLADYWQLTEADVLTQQWARKGYKASDPREQNLAFFFLSEMDEETQEIDSIVRQRLHKNHRGYALGSEHAATEQAGAEHTGSEADIKRTDLPTDYGTEAGFRYSPTFQQPEPDDNSSIEQDNHDVNENDINETGQPLPQDQLIAEDAAIQIIALTQTLDEFLIHTSTRRATESGLARAFLRQDIRNPFDKHLTEALCSLVNQELVLLP